MYNILYYGFTAIIVVCMFIVGVNSLITDHQNRKQGGQELKKALYFLENNLGVTLKYKVKETFRTQPRYASFNFFTKIIVINTALLSSAKSSPYPDILIPAVILHEKGHALSAKLVNSGYKKIKAGLISAEEYRFDLEVAADDYAVSVMPKAACALEYILRQNPDDMKFPSIIKKRIARLYLKCRKFKETTQANRPAYFNTLKSDFCVFL